jgi:hypothetical protein
MYKLLNDTNYNFILDVDKNDDSCLLKIGNKHLFYIDIYGDIEIQNDGKGILIFNGIKNKGNIYLYIYDLCNIIIDFKTEKIKIY